MRPTLEGQKTLDDLGKFLEQSAGLSADAGVLELVKDLPESELERLLQLLRSGRHPKLMSKVPGRVGPEDTDVFTRRLDDPNPLVVRVVIGILFEIDAKRAVERIAPALKHPDESVRLLAANRMLEHGDADAARLFIPLLGESSRRLLDISLQFFARHVTPEAFEHLVSLTAQRRFRGLDRRRQQLAFEALLSAAPVQGVEYLQTKVLRRAFCLDRNSRVKKIAAISALRIVDTDDALALLLKFATRRGGPLALAARRAIELRQQAVRSAQQDGAVGKGDSILEVTRS